MATLQPNQTLLILSALSNLGSCVTGTIDQIEAYLTRAITSVLDCLRGDIGPWQVVWGPAVYQAWDSDLADNVMYVAKGTFDPAQPPQLVVSIAGTNPYSVFDWLLEDGFVSLQLPWPFGSPPLNLKPKIALGTSVGLLQLMSMVPGAGRPGFGTTLQEFLRAELTGNTPLLITGHSLGGALSPTVALWLSDTRSQWDPNGRAALSCLPSAGPTPGNQDFATYYDSQLGGGTTRIHNSLDVVPHAWSQSDLAAIPDLFLPEIKPDFLVSVLVDTAISISKKGDYAQILPSAPALPGIVNQSLISLLNTDFQNLTDFQNFVVQMRYQHVDAYFALLNMSGYLWIMDCVKEAAAPLHGPQGRLAVLRNRLEHKRLIALQRQQP
jgi:Lipase (class 3)